jgi:hypothetical protein
MKIIKFAKNYKVVYFPGFTAPSNTVEIRVDPSDLEKGTIDQIIERRLQLRHPKEAIIIDKIIPIGDINWKTLTKREQAHQRGERRRKEIERRKLEKELESMNKEKVNVEEIVKQIDEQTDEVNFLDLLRSKKRIEKPFTESPAHDHWYDKSLK